MLTRRQFLKAVGAGVMKVAAGALPQLGLEEEEMPKDRVLRVIDARRSRVTHVIGGGGAAWAGNADTVDGFDASGSPAASTLLALDASSQFPESVYPEAVTRDGTRALTADWNAGTYTITADQLVAANQGVKADTMIEYTTDAGVTIETVLIKDGLVDGLDVGNAKTAIQFVVMVATGDLDAERVLTAGDGLDLADGGAGGNATLAVDLAATSGLTFTGGDLAVGQGNGISVGASSIAVALASPSGLEFSAGQLRLADSIAGNGLGITAKVLAVNTGTGLTTSGDNVVLDWSGTPNVIEPDDSAAAGSSSYAARIDHEHGIVCAAPGADSVNVAASAEGTGTSFARSDHTHNLDESIAPTWTGAHTFQTTVAIQSQLTARNVVPEDSDTYDLGTATVLWRKGYLSELDAIVFAQQTLTLLGGWLMLSKGEGTVAEDVDTTETQIDFGPGASLAQNDFVLFRAVGKVEYMQIGTNVSGDTWNVTRDVDGSGANSWPQGAPYVNLGCDGDGRIELNAYDTPRVSLLRQGTSYNVQTEVVRIGDLNGNWGYTSETYGTAVGEYVSGKSNITVDPTNGVRLRVYDATRFQVANDGSLWAGDSATTERMSWDSTNGFQILNASNQAVVKFPISGNAEIVGTLLITGTLATGVSPNPRVQINSSYLAGYSDATTKEFYLDCTTGEAYAGGGVVKLSNDGIVVEIGTAFQDGRSYQFKNTSGTVMGTVGGYQNVGSIHYVRVHAAPVTNENCFVLLEGEAATNQYGHAAIRGTYGTATATIQVSAGPSELYALATVPEFRIDQEQDDGDILQLWSTDDVDHGMTTYAPTEVYGTMRKIGGDTGGLLVRGLTEGAEALILQGMGVTDNTTKTTAASAYLRLAAYKRSGTGPGCTTVGSNANILVLRDYNLSRFIFDADADLYQVGGGVHYINESANVGMTVGVTVNQGAYDDQIMAFKSSDVAHGMTDLVGTGEDDTYTLWKKASGDSGGVRWEGYTEATEAIYLQGDCTSGNTTKGSTGVGVIMLAASKKSGAGHAACGTDENLVVIRNHGDATFIFDAEGSAHAEVEWTTFDEHDDVTLLGDFETAMLADRDPIRGAMAEFLTYNRPELERLGIAHFDDRTPGRAMVNFTRLAMLLVGAVQQVSNQVANVDGRLFNVELALAA